MENKNAKRPRPISLLHVCTCFLLCGCIGWVYETIVESIYRGQFAFRGFLFNAGPLGQRLPFLAGTAVAGWPLVWGMPLILIYGIGGTIMCLAFRRWLRHPLKLFVVGAVLLSAVELLGSYLCEWTLGYQLWDYSYMPLNFEGRISAVSAAVWGLLSVVAVRLVDPLLYRVYRREAGHRAIQVVVYLLFGWAMVCALLRFWVK